MVRAFPVKPRGCVHKSMDRTRREGLISRAFRALKGSPIPSHTAGCPGQPARCTAGGGLKQTSSSPQTSTPPSHGGGLGCKHHQESEINCFLTEIRCRGLSVFIPTHSHNTICFGLPAYSGECREYQRTYERMPLKSKWMVKQLGGVEGGKNHPGDGEYKS